MKKTIFIGFLLIIVGIVLFFLGMYTNEFTPSLRVYATMAGVALVLLPIFYVMVSSKEARANIGGKVLTELEEINLLMNARPVAIVKKDTILTKIVESFNKLQFKFDKALGDGDSVTAQIEINVQQQKPGTDEFETVESHKLRVVAKGSLEEGLPITVK